MYNYVKAIHIIFIVTWFAGLFYMPRLFVYVAETKEKPEVEQGILLRQLLLMSKRLWLGITWPSAILTLIFGGWVWYMYPATPGWLWVKLGFVAGLYGYHLSLHYIFKKQQTLPYHYSGNQMRIWNEVATVFLIAIIMLVVVKDNMSLVYGLLGLVALIVLLMVAIRVYKKVRTSTPEPPQKGRRE